MRIAPELLLQDFEYFGLLFESFCSRDLRVYADAKDGEIFHYRDRNGLEADIVIRLRDGRWGLCCADWMFEGLSTKRISWEQSRSYVVLLFNMEEFVKENLKAAAVHKDNSGRTCIVDGSYHAGNF